MEDEWPDGGAREQWMMLLVRGTVALLAPCPAGAALGASLERSTPQMHRISLGRRLVATEPKGAVSGAVSRVHASARYQQELGQAGVQVDSVLLHSFEDATQVQVNDAGERLVTNGPFAESREYLGGYQIIDVPDLDAALDWAARCPGGRYRRVEVRPLAEF